MQLDPNDENIILSIPEDTGPVVKENASTLTPKKVQHCCLKTTCINFYQLFVSNQLGNRLASY